ncbi:MAG: RagB/SusD family nutrient uptake outer membrane protein [Marinifilum sp.]|jgi:hypothetical protein|nr:RagB/SusD family nutrient uptake outer membrane protein [Marinifilum sp.]
MKNILYGLLILSGLTLFSCDNWLDVKPKSQVREDEMFETEGGFQDALTGLYLKLKSPGLYGKDLTLSTTEFMVYHWSVPADEQEVRALLEYDYSNRYVKNKMASIYGKMYNVIANANSILENIDENKAVFSDGMYEIIKGEALAIRAYCHFDLLRLFGPIPTGDPTNLDFPYVTNLSKEVNMPSSYANYTNLILKDLSDAEALLKDKDPIVKYSVEDLNQIHEGEFQPYDDYSAFRRYRMNYYVVLGLKARFYLWTQNKAEAYKYAKMVISATNEDGSLKFNLGVSSDFAELDYTLVKEHLLGLHVFNLVETSTNLFTYGHYSMRQGYVNNYIFNNDPTDIRLNNLWIDGVNSSGKNISFFKKYNQDKDVNYLKKQVIPLMRLSEMYLIAIETSSLPESNTLFEKFAQTRDFIYAPFIDEADRLSRVIKEYNKEFWGEGQMFYAYKRHGVKNVVLSQIDMSDEQYVVPVPDTEILSN